MAQVFVKRVTVEYVSGGKLFKVQFDPATVGSIVFNMTDKDRAQKEQAEAEGEVKPVLLKADEQLPLEVQVGQITEKTGVLTATAPVPTPDAEPGPPLWWHTNSCTWFHPEL
jgi:hypothetical protein